MNPPPPSPQLRGLVDRHLDGSLTRLEMAQLEELLRAPESLDYYLQAVEIQSGLQEMCASGHLTTASPLPLPATKTPLASRRLLACAAALVTLAVAIALAFAPRAPSPPTADRPPQPALDAARIIQHIGGPEPTSTSLRIGSTLTVGAGLTELELASGPRLLLEGPAELELTDSHRALLRSGTCTITVPRSNNRFTLASPHGAVWAVDAEFAVTVPGDGGGMDLGVLGGRAWLSRGDGAKALPVGPRDAIRIATDTGPRTISFPFDSIHRRFPSRELPWRAPPGSFEPVVVEHDLNGLIWGPGPHRVYFKWMHGSDALLVHSAELLLDGQPVAADVHDGIAGDPLHTARHAYHFDLPADAYRPGAWSLRSVVQTNPRHLGQIQLPDEVLNPSGVVLLADDPRVRAAREQAARTIEARPDSHGVLLVEQGRAAAPHDFCHTWEYTHNGLWYRRTFFENGTARLERDGEILPNFDRATWTVVDGVLTLTICHPDTDAFECIERHLLRDQDTLLFLDRPYRNARRME